MAETQEQRAERLTPLADELVDRIRTEPPDVLCADLLPRLRGDQLVWDLCSLIMLLAAGDDPTVDPTVRWGWARYREALAAAEPIVWADDEQPIEAMDSQQITALIVKLAGERRSDSEIAEVTGLSPDAVNIRRRRARAKAGLRRGDVRTARAGVDG